MAVELRVLPPRSLRFSPRLRTRWTQPGRLLGASSVGAGEGRGRREKTNVPFFPRKIHAPRRPPPTSFLFPSTHTQVVDHYERPRNVGSFPKDDPDVGTGLVGAPACGDVMKLQIRVDADGNIVDSCFKTFGCGSAIASSSVATEWVKGRTLDDVTSIKNADIAKHLSLPPVKLHCSMLAEDAVKAAVKDIKAKRAAAAGKAAAEGA